MAPGVQPSKPPSSALRQVEGPPTFTMLTPASSSADPPHAHPAFSRQGPVLPGGAAAWSLPGASFSGGGGGGSISGGQSQPEEAGFTVLQNIKEGESPMPGGGPEVSGGTASQLLEATDHPGNTELWDRPPPGNAPSNDDASFGALLNIGLLGDDDPMVALGGNGGLDKFMDEDLIWYFGA